MTQNIKTDPDSYLNDLFVKHRRVYMGDELKQKLVENLGKSASTSRKIVERFAAKGFVETSKPISFGKNTYAYFPVGKKITFDELIGLTRNRRPPLFRLLSSIKSCGGIISYYEALKICSTPLKKSKSKTPLLDHLISELTHFDAVTLQSDQNNNKYLVASFVNQSSVKQLIAQHFSLMMVDAALLYDVLISLSKFNLIDNSYIRYRDRRTPTKGQEHNNYVWDAFSYTKTTGINTTYGNKKNSPTTKQALVVVDMVISRRFELFDYDGFNERVRVLQNNTKTERKIIPIIVFRDISSEALRKARAFGMLTYNMAAFFGNGIYEVIDNLKLIKMSENAALTSPHDTVQTIADTLELVEETGNLYNLSNMTGDFFQSLMYQLFHDLYPNSTIEQGKKLPAMDDTIGRKKKYEYDFVIQAINTDEIIAVELKGTMSNYAVQLGDGNKKNSLKWFFERTFPSFMQHYGPPLYMNTKIRACFITSGRFDRPGESYLMELNKGKLKPASIELSYNGKQLLKLVNEKSLHTLRHTLERYFVQTDK